MYDALFICNFKKDDFSQKNLECEEVFRRKREIFRILDDALRWSEEFGCLNKFNKKLRKLVKKVF